MSKPPRVDDPGDSSRESSRVAIHQPSPSSPSAGNTNPLAVKMVGGVSAVPKTPPPRPKKSSISVQLAKPNIYKQGNEYDSTATLVDSMGDLEDMPTPLADRCLERSAAVDATHPMKRFDKVEGLSDGTTPTLDPAKPGIDGSLNKGNAFNIERERSPVNSELIKPPTSDISLDSEAVPVIYRARIIDPQKPTAVVSRYSFKPFENLVDEPIPSGGSRKPYAIMDALYTVTGTWPGEPRKNQLRDSFYLPGNDNEEPFVFGRDFIARLHGFPVIRIHSPLVNDLLRKLVQYYPGYDLEGTEIVHQHPYPILSHYHDELCQIRDAYGEQDLDKKIKIQGHNDEFQCSKELSAHLSQIISFVDGNYYNETAVKELELHRNGRATFGNLWLLFKPGEIVFANVRGEVAGFVVWRVSLTQQNKNDSKSPKDKWIVHLWNLGYTGAKLTRQASTYSIDRFQGEKDISTLDVFPTKYLNDRRTSPENLIKRGKKYYDIMCNLPAYRKHDGPVIDEPPQNYTGYIMIDFQSYLLYAEKRPSLSYKIRNPIEQANATGSGSNDFISSEQPQDYGGGKLFSKFNDMECSSGSQLEESQYLLLLGYVLGYSLGKKQWIVIFNMNYVQPIDEPKTPPMRNLILDEKTKRLVSAMATNHLANNFKSWNADLINGKGEGKVVLLHGAPGTGKTLTVECIASEAKRPLLSLSVADLGIREVEMEKKLSDWLARAALWGAIVMIDEAEVYLESREDQDLARNALVTAFLRTIEYYPGLLFLTTNRSGRLDEAVRSRIHIAVKYEKPDAKQQSQMWTNLINRLEADQKLGDSSTKGSDTKSSSVTIELSSKAKMLVGWIDPEDPNKEDIQPPVPAPDMNGRDIRNALLSAINYAQYDAFQVDPQTKRVVVKVDHIELVLKNKTTFVTEFVDTHGMTLDQFAVSKFQRAPQKQKSEVG